VGIDSEEPRDPDEKVLFAVETRSARGIRRVRHARNVVLAIGYYDHPNLVGIPGEDLPHVHHYYAEPHPYYRQRVVVVGGGNSAAESALELHRAGAHVTLVHRWAELKSTIKYWVKPDIENRIKEDPLRRGSTRASPKSADLDHRHPRTEPSRARGPAKYCHAGVGPPQSKKTNCPPMPCSC
jgi:thioredoxin reductase